MVFPTQQIYIQACRLYSSRAGTFSRGDQVGAAITAAWCGLAFSAPFAGAALVSRNAKKDDRYAKMRPLSFRDCLPCSPLEDYAGLRRPR